MAFVSKSAVAWQRAPCDRCGVRRPVVLFRARFASKYRRGPCLRFCAKCALRPELAAWLVIYLLKPVREWAKERCK